MTPVAATRPRPKGIAEPLTVCPGAELSLCCFASAHKLQSSLQILEPAEQAFVAGKGPGEECRDSVRSAFQPYGIGIIDGRVEAGGVEHHTAEGLTVGKAALRGGRGIGGLEMGERPIDGALELIVEQREIRPGLASSGTG